MVSTDVEKKNQNLIFIQILRKYFFNKNLKILVLLFRNHGNESLEFQLYDNVIFSCACLLQILKIHFFYK